MMIVKLLRDVREIGRAGQIISVKPAYARNFLLPKKMAVMATPAVVAAVTKELADAVAAQKKSTIELAALSTRLEGMTVNMTAKANPQGTLFAAIKAPQVLAAIANQLGRRLPAATTVTSEQIKTVGDHAVVLTISQQTITCHLHVDHA